MSATEAQIRANQANSARSTGPKTIEGKEKSRQNALKHGLTGEGIVFFVEDAVEVDQRFEAFREELRPSGRLGLTLVKRAASLAVRMEKCSEREIAIVADRVASALAEFEAPEGIDPREATRLRTEAGRLAAFDVSKEACLARRYEAAAERGFYRALKELRLVEKQAKTSGPIRETDSFPNELASFLESSKISNESKAAYCEPGLPSLNNPLDSMIATHPATFGRRVDVPFSIGRAR